MRRRAGRGARAGDAGARLQGADDGAPRPGDGVADSAAADGGAGAGGGTVTAGQQFAAVPALRSRVRGAVLGAAIGDALGHPTEFLSASAIRRRFPPTGVEGFELWWQSDGRRFAPYTDDTQMAEIVLRALVDGGRSEEDLDAVMRE